VLPEIIDDLLGDLSFMINPASDIEPGEASPVARPTVSPTYGYCLSMSIFSSNSPVEAIRKVHIDEALNSRNKTVQRTM